MNPDDLHARVDGLCDGLAAEGYLRSRVWRDALHAAPRHLFVPDRAWAEPNGSGPGFVIDRIADAGAWWDAVYADNAIVTQRGDGRVDVGDHGEASSSCSAPATAVEFLERLAPERGDRVLEVGTGTGWTAALLSSRVGDGNVVTVDIDRSVSEVAAKNLAAAGVNARLVVGDGVAGVADAGVLDRVHVAAGVAEIPYAWVEQTRPGGVIVLPFMPGWGFGWLLCLYVRGDGTAVGRFPGLAGYMMLRDQRPGGAMPSERARRDYTETSTRLDPRRVESDSSAADLAIAAMVPRVRSRVFHGEGDAADESTLWLLERGDDSWASVDYVPGAGEFVVQQHGPRRLWDEVEAAYRRWTRLGRPDVGRFGMTVTPEGQRVWLDSPGASGLAEFEDDEGAA